MPRLGSSLNCGGLKVYNLDGVTTDVSAAATVGRLTTVEAALSAAIATQEATLRAAINNLDVKDGCVVAATENVNIATGGLITIQGVALLAGDRVLLTNQTDGTENGIYVVAAGAWTRSPDADVDAEVTSGMAVPVRGGDLKNQDLWILGTPDPITLGTTELEFSRQRNLRDLTIAGGGLNLSASYILTLIGKEDEIYINPTGGIEIDDAYPGQESINTVGEVTTGTWAADTIDIAHGGTGATTLNQLRTNLGIPQEFSMPIGDGATTIFTIAHGFNNTNIPKPSVYEIATGDYVDVNFRMVDANTIAMEFSNPPANNSMRFVMLAIKKPA